VVVYGWRAMPNWRYVLGVIVVALMCIQVSVTVSRFRKDPYKNKFVPAAEFVRTIRKPGEPVMASSEMALCLGFDSSFIDDYRLGYRSGKRADILVLDEARYQAWIGLLAKQDPQNYWFIQRLLASQYRPVYDQDGYRIYKRIAN
jgi:hypothetical protein